MRTPATVPDTTPLPMPRSQVTGQILAGSRLFYFVVILVVGLALRTVNLGSADLWTDEVITAMRASVGIIDSLETMLTAGNQVPFYYLIMRVLPHDSEFSLRLPAAILGVFNVALLSYVVSEIHSPDMGLGAGALLAINPMHVELSRTARFYTLLVLLSLLSVYAFLRILHDSHSRRDWWLLGISSLLAYMTHYTALAMLVAQCLIMLQVAGFKSKKFRTFLLIQFTAALPLIIWALVMASYVGTETYPGIAHVPALNDILLTYLYLLTGDASVAALSVLPGVIAVGGALVMGILAFQSTVDQKTSYLFWFILAVLPVVALFVLSHMAGIRYQDRYFTVALPAVMLIFLLGCAKLPRSVGLLAFSIVLFTGAYQSVQQSVVGDNSRTDWTGASAYIEDRLLMTDQMVFQRWTTYQAFIDHLPENSSVVADVVLFEELPTGVTLELDARRMWVIYRAPKQDFHAQEWLSDFDPFLPTLSPLSDWLIEHQAQIVESKRFKGVTVLLLAPSRAASFEFSIG